MIKIDTHFDKIACRFEKHLAIEGIAGYNATIACETVTLNRYIGRYSSGQVSCGKRECQ